MTAQLLKRFRQSLYEVFANAREHAQSQCGIAACGQYFPKKERLDFTIADLGIGIRRNVANSLGLRMSSVGAIEWALTEGNTTRQDNRPGGLGLDLIREFVGLNGGGLIIVSDRGYWEMRGGTVTTVKLERAFPGTAVTIEVKTDDTSLYALKSELSPENVF